MTASNPESGFTPEDEYKYGRIAAVMCNPYNDDYRHENCRHAWNASHPDDPVTLEEQIQFSADIPWRHP